MPPRPLSGSAARGAAAILAIGPNTSSRHPLPPCGELKRFVKERLSPYKYPHRIEFIEELPKTATGKAQRFRLRERAVKPT